MRHCNIFILIFTFFFQTAVHAQISYPYAIGFENRQEQEALKQYIIDTFGVNNANPILTNLNRTRNAIQNASVKIVLFNQKLNPISEGSGFVITHKNKQYLITAHHVVAKLFSQTAPDRAKLYGRNWQQELKKEDLYKEDRIVDQIAFTFKRQGIVGLKIIPFAKADQTLFAKTMTCGFPFGFNFSVCTRGFNLAKNHKKSLKKKRYTVSSSAVQGMSGGPVVVLDSFGKLQGVLGSSSNISAPDLLEINMNVDDRLIQTSIKASGFSVPLLKNIPAPDFSAPFMKDMQNYALMNFKRDPLLKNRRGVDLSHDDSYIELINQVTAKVSYDAIEEAYYNALTRTDNLNAEKFYKEYLQEINLSMKSIYIQRSNAALSLGVMQFPWMSSMDIYEIVVALMTDTETAKDYLQHWQNALNLIRTDFENLTKSNKKRVRLIKSKNLVDFASHVENSKSKYTALPDGSYAPQDLIDLTDDLLFYGPLNISHTGNFFSEE